MIILFLSQSSGDISIQSWCSLSGLAWHVEWVDGSGCWWLLTGTGAPWHWAGLGWTGPGPGTGNLETWHWLAWPTGAHLWPGNRSTRGLSLVNTVHTGLWLADGDMSQSPEMLGRTWNQHLGSSNCCWLLLFNLHSFPHTKPLHSFPSSSNTWVFKLPIFYRRRADWKQLFLCQDNIWECSGMCHPGVRLLGWDSHLATAATTAQQQWVTAFCSRNLARPILTMTTQTSSGLLIGSSGTELSPDAAWPAKVDISDF